MAPSTRRAPARATRSSPFAPASIPTKDPPRARLRPVPRQREPGDQRQARRPRAARAARPATATAPSPTRCILHAATRRSRSAGTTSRRRSISRRPPEQSELLRRPLSPAQGGAYHEGGVIFTLAERLRLHGAERLGEGARPARGRHQRPGLHLLLAEGAADAREEGLHDGAVPLGVDVPRLPPARRLGRQLLALGDAQELRALARAALDRERGSRTRAASSARTCIAPRSARWPGATARRASPIAAVRCSRTSRGRPRTRKVCADAKYDYDNGRPRQDPGVLRVRRVAEARTRRVQARAALARSST